MTCDKSEAHVGPKLKIRLCVNVSDKIDQTDASLPLKSVLTGTALPGKSSAATINIMKSPGVSSAVRFAREQLRKTGYRTLAVATTALIFAVEAEGSGAVYNPVPILTLAGLAANPGFVNGTGSAARFNTLGGIAVDTSGRIFVADGGNHAIRMVTPWGVVTTIAGTGSPGFFNGPGNSAKFSYPQGIAADNSGTLYVADTGNNKIRKIVLVSGAWTVSTFAAGFTGFNQPAGVAVDPSGNVYVADTGNNQVVKFNSSGSLQQTFSGFNIPVGLAAENSGNIYVANAASNQIKKISTSNVVSVFAGTGTQGNDDYPVASATFHGPKGIAADSLGNVYVADSADFTLRKISSGAVRTLAGQVGIPGFANGVGSAAQFRGSTGVAIDPSTGIIYIADTDNHTVRTTKLVQQPPKVTKAFIPSVITPGQAVDVVFTITNSPGNPAQTGLGFLDSLPNPPFNAGGAVSSNTCGGFATILGPAVSLGNAAMSAGTSQCTVTFHMNPPNGCGLFPNTIGNVHYTNLDTSGVNASLNINCPPPQPINASTPTPASKKDDKVKAGPELSPTPSPTPKK